MYAMVAALNSRPQICTSYLYHHPPSVSSVSEGEPKGARGLSKINKVLETLRLGEQVENS
jgi:hypothetical protein